MNPHTMKTINAFLVFATASLCSAANPAFTIDAGHPVGKVSPTLYGLMTEEINHAYDGGLYAELLQNRAFRDSTTSASHWSIHRLSVDAGDTHFEEAGENGIPDLKIQINSADSASPVGVINDGYWGIPVKPSTTYH